MDEYLLLQDAVERAGFFTTFQPIKDAGDRIVCAAEGGNWGLGGRSFWLAVRQTRWFIATWTPRIYEIPNPQDVPHLAIQVLKCNDSHCYDIDADIQRQFGLIEVTDDEFSTL